MTALFISSLCDMLIFWAKPPCVWTLGCFRVSLSSLPDRTPRGQLFSQIYPEVYTARVKTRKKKSRVGAETKVVLACHAIRRGRYEVGKTRTAEVA